MPTRPVQLTFLAALAFALPAWPAAPGARPLAVQASGTAWGVRPHLPDSDEFLEAVRTGDLEAVSRLLDEREELIDGGDERGRSPFVLAKLHGQGDVARLLLRRGYMLDVVDAAMVPDWERVRLMLDDRPELANAYHPVGGTVLYAAARLGHPQLWRLLGMGADPDANPLGEDGVTAAFGALECPDPLDAWIAAVDLFSMGGDVNAPQRGGWSALHAAVARDHERLVRFLVRSGADVDARDREGRTPLDVAKERGLETMVALLEDHESIPRDPRSSRLAYDSEGRPITLPDMSGVPPARGNMLGRMAQSQVQGVAKAIADDRRLVFARSFRDELAVETAARSGRHDIVGLLLENGAPQSLCTSIMIGDLDRARELLAEDPRRVHERSSLDYPPMWFAAIGGSGVEAAALLLEHGADVDQESLGTTGLHWAAREGNVALARFLLENGARLDAVGYTFSRDGRTPLEVARGRRNGRMVDFLEQWASAGD